MNCREFEARLHPYVDGELSVGETAAAEAHCAECWACAARVRHEREFRELLRRQPRETAPPELKRRLQARLRVERRRTMLRTWFALPAVAAAAAALVVFGLWSAQRAAPPLVADLVDKHIAYAQINGPAELPSTDPAQIRQWFRQRAGLSVAVPDFSPAGIALLGARLVDAQERQAAYLLYEKGMTLLSVFAVPLDDGRTRLVGREVSYRGHEYVTSASKGLRTVAWTHGRTLFALVSALDYDALLQCADRLRLERASQTEL